MTCRGISWTDVYKRQGLRILWAYDEGYSHHRGDALHFLHRAHVEAACEDLGKHPLTHIESRKEKRETSMNVTYIYHSSFLVETVSAYLLFDYFKGELPRMTPSKPIYVFASHRHEMCIRDRCTIQ